MRDGKGVEIFYLNLKSVKLEGGVVKGRFNLGRWGSVPSPELAKNFPGPKKLFSCTVSEIFDSIHTYTQIHILILLNNL